MCFMKSQTRKLCCILSIVHRFSQLIRADFARLNKLRKESVAGLNHGTRGQNTDYLHQYACARRSEFLFNPQAHRALCVNTNKRIIDLQLAGAVQGGLRPKWILNKRTCGSEAEQRAEIDRRAIDTEMKFTTANTPSVFSSVSICRLIRYCPLIRRHAPSAHGASRPYLLLIRERRHKIIGCNHQLIICTYNIGSHYVAIMRKQVKHNMNY